MTTSGSSTGRPQLRDWLGSALVVLCIGAAVNGDSSALQAFIALLSSVL